MTFVGGVTTKFSGHEPDAQSTNPQTWINQAFSGPDTSLWYHPNDLGQVAYSELLLAGGTYGAGTGGSLDDPVDRTDRDAEGASDGASLRAGRAGQRCACGSAARTARPPPAASSYDEHTTTRSSGPSASVRRPTAASGCGSAASTAVAPGSS